MWLFSLSPLKASSEIQAFMPRQMYSLGSFPNASLKSMRYSASTPPQKCLSLSQAAWLASLVCRQLSRSWVGRNPGLWQRRSQPVLFSVCSTEKVFPDSCTHFTRAKRSTEAAAAWVYLNKLHSERCKVMSFREQRLRHRDTRLTASPVSVCSLILEILTRSRGLNYEDYDVFPGSQAGRCRTHNPCPSIKENQVIPLPEAFENFRIS